ncbi:MAG TPA: hypothetical protein HA257_03840 [Candidatus Methanoperedenaceae archaeon]|nr:hypothetical protein [Candidatus Methanoperedenaceae archaeon]
MNLYYNTGGIFIGNTTVRAPDVLLEGAKAKGINMSAVFRNALEAALELKTLKKVELLERKAKLLLEAQKLQAERGLIDLELTEIESQEHQLAEQAEIEKNRPKILSALLKNRWEEWNRWNRDHAVKAGRFKDVTELKLWVEEYQKNPESDKEGARPETNSGPQPLTGTCVCGYPLNGDGVQGPAGTGKWHDLCLQGFQCVNEFCHGQQDPDNEHLRNIVDLVLSEDKFAELEEAQVKAISAFYFKQGAPP